ncbi:MAG: discoidin domain-containing protein [Planctomycetota bacterium]|jgi:hypothetical protein
MWVTTRDTASDPWGTPVNLGPTVNSSAYDDYPFVTADGLALFFTSTRPGTYGICDMFVSRRATTDDDWGTPVNLGPTVNSGDSVNLPRISADGSTLYFISNRAGGVGRCDIWQVPIIPPIAPPAWMIAPASDPSPANRATDAPRDVVLSWTPGIFVPAINGHKVYFSENFNDVDGGIGGIAQDANSFTPPQRLDFETTYYWRVDEVNGPPDSTVFKGNFWSFTTEPVGYPIGGANITATASSAGQADLGPENTINGSGLDENDLHSTEAADMWLSGNELLGAWIQYEFDKVHKLHEMWVWNSNQTFEALFGFGMKDVTVEYSTNETDWTALAGVPEFAQAPGISGYAHDTTVDFGGAVAKYIKLTAASNWAAGVPPDVILGWRAGRERQSRTMSMLPSTNRL